MNFATSQLSQARDGMRSLSAIRSLPAMRSLTVMSGLPAAMSCIASVLICALCVIALAVASAQAQSGRRVERQKEIAPVPTPTPAPEAKKSASVPALRISLLVLADNTYAMGAGTMTQGVVEQTFIQRLHESPALGIATDSARTTRSGASKRAKDEKERFVVWITLRSNGFNDPAGVRQPRAEDYYIEYAIYEPVTGKTHASGNVYLRPGYGSIGGVAVGAPSCYPATYANEYEFVFGAIDTANRVMRSLNLPLPPVCGGT